MKKINDKEVEGKKMRSEKKGRKFYVKNRRIKKMKR